MKLEVQDVDDQEKEKMSVGSNPGYENVISKVRPNAQKVLDLRGNERPRRSDQVKESLWVSIQKIGEIRENQNPF
jgi:hypothetical protein